MILFFYCNYTFSHLLKAVYSFDLQKLAKAIATVTKAVLEDEKKNYRDAYYAYCEGLQHFVPLISSETDAEKRLFLQQAATNYLERAEEIKRSYIEVFSQQDVTQNSVQNSQSEATSSSGENAVKEALKPAPNYKQIRK